MFITTVDVTIWPLSILTHLNIIYLLVCIVGIIICAYLLVFVFRIIMLIFECLNGVEAEEYEEYQVDYKMFMYDWHTSHKAHDPKKDGEIDSYVARDYGKKGECLYKIKSGRVMHYERPMRTVPEYNNCVYADRILDAEDWKMYKGNCQCGGESTRDPKGHCLKWYGGPVQIQCTENFWSEVLKTREYIKKKQEKEKEKKEKKQDEKRVDSGEISIKK